jgi:2-oxoisovalerate dehydrogenase E2 component (dihydrolipoyl transacylase)
MAELKQFRLPDVGEGLTEAEIVKWHVRAGDQVVVNQTIVEIETAKAVVELPCPYAGVVSSLMADEGATVDVGTPIISVDVSPGSGGAPADGGQDREATAAAVAAEHAAITQTAAHDLVPPPPVEAATEPGMHGSPAPKQKEERQAVLVGYGVKLGTTTRRARKTPASRGTNGSAASTVTAPAGRDPVPAERVQALAKPPVRKLAKDLGVDLATLAGGGTGPNGSITRDDVQQAAAGAGRPAPQAAVRADGPREERIAIRGVRKHTAAATASSAFTAPHVTEFLQVDVTETMAAVARLKELPDFEGQRVSPLLLVARALLIAAARHPMINASWDQDAQEIVVKHYVNLGIAAATDRGLVVPNIKDAHAMSLPELGRALGELAATARSGRASVADLQGGTITITNVGVFGVDAGTPILTPGEAAILAFGQVRDTAWVHQGELAIRKVTTLSLSFDHRVVDGDLGSAVLRDVGAMLADPLRMLAWS